MDPERLGGAGNMIDPETVAETQALNSQQPGDATGAVQPVIVEPAVAASSDEDEVEEIFAGDSGDAAGVDTPSRPSELYDNSGDLAGTENTTGVDEDDLG
jgi:hypothetical protein